MNRASNDRKNSSRKSSGSDWRIYAAAAGATLSMATGADASIVTGSLNVTVSLNPGNTNTTIQQKQFNIAGVTGFAQLLRIHTEGKALLSFPGLIRSRNSSEFGPPLPGKVKRYAPNAPITGGGAVSSFLGGGTSLFFRVANFHVTQGLFRASDRAYLGFELANGDLGWLKVILSDRNSDGFPDQLQVVDYAYNTVAGQSILAGDTGQSATPEPGTASLGLLAFGAAGILALRRRRIETATKSN